MKCGRQLGNVMFTSSYHVLEDHLSVCIISDRKHCDMKYLKKLYMESSYKDKGLNFIIVKKRFWRICVLYMCNYYTNVVGENETLLTSCDMQSRMPKTYKCLQIMGLT